MKRPRPGPGVSPTFEPDLRQEMFAALWEDDVHVDDVEEWFKEPWKDGRNAVRLCLDVALNVDKVGGPAARSSSDAVKAISFLMSRMDLDRSSLSTEDYHAADELRYELSRSNFPNDEVLEAGLAIHMNWIANSDGGGHVPNSHLLRAFWPLLRDRTGDDQQILHVVGKHRAVDLGFRWPPESQRDHAFRWFWLNRRYRLAFTVR